MNDLRDVAEALGYKIGDRRMVPEDFNPREYLPRVLPVGWRLVQGGRIGDDGAMYVNGPKQLSVICSIAKEDDGRLWLHASIASSKRLPSYANLMELKRIFIGDNRPAYMVLPRKSKHVNIHKNCLHLFAPLQGTDPLPDFTHGGESL